MGKTGSFSQQLIGFLHKLPHHRDAVAELVRSMVRADAPRQGVGDMVSLTSQEIFDVWARARRVGAARGTWMRAQIECLLNGGCVTSTNFENEGGEPSLHVGDQTSSLSFCET